MKRFFYLALVLVFSLTAANAFAQAAAPGSGKAAVAAEKKDVAAGKLSLADLEGLTEEQILALLKKLELDDIMYYLKLAVAGGTRELLVNMLGALNAYMASLDPQKALEVAQKVVADNPQLSFGIGRNGKPVVFIPKYNNLMNDIINNTNQTQQNMNDDKPVVSGGGSL